QPRYSRIRSHSQAERVLENRKWETGFSETTMVWPSRNGFAMQCPPRIGKMVHRDPAGCRYPPGIHHHIRKQFPRLSIENSVKVRAVSPGRSRDRGKNRTRGAARNAPQHDDAPVPDRYAGTINDERRLAA